MGTTGPGRTAFGSTQGARADHPPAGLGKAIITGLFGVARPIPAGLNQARIDPSPGSQGFALLGQALSIRSPGLRSVRTLQRNLPANCYIPGSYKSPSVPCAPPGRAVA